MKWFIFLSFFFTVRLVFKRILAETPGRWYEPKMIAISSVGSAGIFSTFLCIATWMWSLDESWIGRLAWHFRGLAWIDGTLALSTLAFVVFAGITASAFASRSGVYAQTAATVFERLMIMVVVIFFAAVYVQYVALTAFAVRSVWSDNYGWAPQVFPFLLKSTSIFWGIGVLVGAVVGTALCLIIAYEALRPLLFLAGLIRPYASGEDLVYGNFDLSLEYQGAGEDLKDARKLLVISDLHITPQGRTPIHSSRDSGESQSFISAVLERAQPDLVVIAGDITDVGDSNSWATVSQLLSPWRQKIFAIPGNHDVHFYRSFSPSFLAAMTVADRELSKNLSSLEGKPIRGFPRVERFDDLSLILIGLDSNRRPPSTPVTNAIGEVGGDQLTKARDAVAKIRKPGDLVIVVLHHHIVSPKFSLFGLFLRCLDAAEILKFASEIEAGAIVHGHKHMPYLARSRTGELPVIISCGSTHHLPDGPLADKANQPSAYEISISRGKIQAVNFIRDTSVLGRLPARSAPLDVPS